MFLNWLSIDRLEHRDTLAPLIDSMLLTGEAWQLMLEGELLAMRDRQVVATKA